MSRSWNTSRYNSWPPTHIAFSSRNSKVEYKFCLNEHGTTGVIPTIGGMITIGLSNNTVPTDTTPGPTDTTTSPTDTTKSGTTTTTTTTTTPVESI